MLQNIIIKYTPQYKENIESAKEQKNLPVEIIPLCMTTIIGDIILAPNIFELSHGRKTKESVKVLHKLQHREEYFKNIWQRIKGMHPLKAKWYGCLHFHPFRCGNFGSKYDKWIVIYRMEVNKTNHNKVTLRLITLTPHKLSKR